MTGMTPEQIAEIRRVLDALGVVPQETIRALLAEVNRLTAERDQCRDLLYRAISIRMHGEHRGDTRYQWATWDRDSDETLRESSADVEAVDR